MPERKVKVFALKHGTLLCPMCKGEIKWGCPADIGSKGSARCQNSSYHFRVLSARDLDLDLGGFCVWYGKTIRLQDGDVAIYW